MNTSNILVMKIYRFLFLLVITGGLTFFAGCGSQVQQKGQDTPTAGRIKVAIDDSYKLLIDAEVYAFETYYKYAKLDTMYKCEADVINDFMNDSVSLIIVNRLLNDNQTLYLKERQYIPKVTKIAIDAVALIINNDNPDTNLFYRIARDLFLGKINDWKQINSRSKLGPIKVVFDNFKSGNPRYFKEKFKLDSLPRNFFTANNNEEVIRYVENNKNAIGVISVNWISDKADSVSNKFLKRFKVIGIALEGDDNPGTKFYKPYPAYISDGSYPFTRDVYCINRQPYSGLAYGFSSFIAGEKGQFIVLHSGLVPAAMPVRIVEIKR
jgi:phosphate transport system substrate-binding protein